VTVTQVERHGTHSHRLAAERHRRCHRRPGRSAARETGKERRRWTCEEARARYVAQVRARNTEHRQLHALFRDASRPQRANRLREFIAAVEDRARHADAPTPAKQQWIEWAKAEAHWLDPLVRRSDPVRDAPAPEAPSYRHFRTRPAM
jgi:hypothetical protein